MERFISVLPVHLHKYNETAPKNGDLKMKTLIDTLKMDQRKNAVVNTNTW